MKLFFQLFVAAFTLAWVIISFMLDKKVGTSVLSYALFVIGCLLYYYNEIIWGSITVVAGICMLVLFFLIYKNEKSWSNKEQ